MAFYLQVTYKCKPGMRAAFLDEVKKQGVRDLIIKEDGCQCYDYYLSEQDPDIILLMETWASADHQKVHMTQPHMKTLGAIKAQFVETTTLQPYEVV